MVRRPYGAKYPFISRITCVRPSTKTLIAPLVPAGTIAAFATTLPSNEFSVETNGCVAPVGHAVRYGNTPSGTTVTFNEYAAAVDGTEQPPAGSTNERTVCAASSGPPNAPCAPRVSTTRHGVSGWNVSSPAPPGCPKYPLMSRTTFAASVTNTETDPLLPAGTSAALATTFPIHEFSVETPGCADPVGGGGGGGGGGG